MAPPSQWNLARRRLALVSGMTLTAAIIDTFGVLFLGMVFLGIQSGNVVFLGLITAGSPQPLLYAVLSSLAAFIIGGLIGGRLLRSVPKGSHWAARYTVIYVIQICCFIAVWFLWLFSVGLPEGKVLEPAVAINNGELLVPMIVYLLMIWIPAIAMGMHGALALRIGVSGMTGLVVTMSVVSVGAMAPGGEDQPKWWHNAVPMAFLALGGLIGGFAFLHFGPGIQLLLAIGVQVIVMLVGAWWFRHDKRAASGQPPQAQVQG